MHLISELRDSPQEEAGVDITIFYMQLGMGGVPRLCVWLANGFAARGLRVDLVIADASNAFPHTIDSKVRVIDLGAKSVPRATLRLARYLKNLKPRNVLSFVANAIAIVGAAKFLSRSQVNFIACEQIETEIEIRSTRFSPYKIALLLVPVTYRQASRLVAASLGVAESLARVMRIDPSQISIVYNPAYRPEIHDRSKIDVDHPWLRANNANLIVTAARFVPQKDLATLLNAFAVVLTHEPNAKLVVLGDGPLRADLETQAKCLGISESVSMPGSDANPFRWFARAKVFAMSSRWEGFGMTLVEAMACGCNIVSTACPSGPSEILDDGRFGTLVPVADTARLGAAIVNALRAPRAGQRNVDRAKEFSLATSVDGYTKLMQAATT